MLAEPLKLPDLDRLFGTGELDKTELAVREARLSELELSKELLGEEFENNAACCGEFKLAEEADESESISRERGLRGMRACDIDKG